MHSQKNKKREKLYVNSELVRGWNTNFGGFLEVTGTQAVEHTLL
jgi:hypothetical protein